MVRDLIELAGLAFLAVGLWQVDYRLALITVGLLLLAASVVGRIVRKPSGRKDGRAE